MREMEIVMEKIGAMHDVEECWSVVRKEIRQVLQFGQGEKRERWKMMRK
jgi:hypothetical protein